MNGSFPSVGPVTVPVNVPSITPPGSSSLVITNLYGSALVVHDHAAEVVVRRRAVEVGPRGSDLCPGPRGGDVHQRQSAAPVEQNVLLHLDAIPREQPVEPVQIHLGQHPGVGRLHVHRAGEHHHRLVSSHQELVDPAQLLVRVILAWLGHEHAREGRVDLLLAPAQVHLFERVEGQRLRQDAFHVRAGAAAGR